MSVVLDARGVRVSLGGHTILHGVDLAARSGMVHGLVGPNGSGKTTLLRALAELIPYTGTVVTSAGPLARLSSRRRARVVSYLPQDTTVQAGFTVGELVRLGRYAHLGRLRGPGPADREAVAAAMEETGIADLEHRTVSTLSGGQRQLVMLAKALAQESQTLLLDEPVSALDLGHQLDLLTLVRALADRGRSVIVVLHDLPLASRYCDEITVLADGAIAAQGRPADVLTTDLLRDVWRVDAVVEPDPAIPAIRIVPLASLWGRPSTTKEIHHADTPAPLPRPR